MVEEVNPYGQGETLDLTSLFQGIPEEILQEFKLHVLRTVAWVRYRKSIGLKTPDGRLKEYIDEWYSEEYHEKIFSVTKAALDE